MHLAPVMAELSQANCYKIAAFVSGEQDRHALQMILADLGCPQTNSNFKIIVMKLPKWYQQVTRFSAELGNSKSLRLLFWQKRLKASDTIIAAERTSTILRRFPGKCPTMIHIPHGAGDRKKGFERRISLFDYVIVGGNKDRNRMIGMQLVTPENCFVSGYVKLSGVIKIQSTKLGTEAPIFDNDRPVILYNPHFDATLSSWHRYGADVIDEITRDGRFNLIVAPHVRLFEKATQSERSAVLAKAVPGQVLIDLGSDRSMDMSYTFAADIYLGDVSSQVYEFMFRPRPCIFFNSHNAQWRGNADYLMWSAGKVISDLGELLPALSSAQAAHIDFAPIQRKLVADAFGDVDGNGAKNAAQIVMQITARLANDQ